MENKNTYPAMIEEAFDTLTAIENDRSAKGKDALLKGHKDNEVLRNLLYYAFNTFKQYYVKAFHMPAAKQGPISTDSYTRFITLLDSLNSHTYENPRAFVESFFTSCNEKEQLWYSRVLKRDLNLGITAKGVNKAWPGFIPVYDVQLAETVKDITLTDKGTIARLPERYVLQYKIDGYRLNIHKNRHGDIDIRTRSGLPVQGYKALEEEARAILPCNRVYDGEMVSPALFAWIEQNMLRDSNERIADRTLFKDAVRQVFSKETDKQGIFNIFDAVDKSEWDSQSAKETYGERLSYIDENISNILLSEGASQMAVVPTSCVFCKNSPEDLKETIRIFHKFLSWGWEGLMIKAVDAPYAWKRSKSLLKMKLMDTADLTVLGVSESTGAGEGMVGTIQCDYEGTTLNIGTGSMSESDRMKFFKNPNLIIGKTIEVAYQAKSIGKDGQPVLDFARYKGIRKDK